MPDYFQLLNKANQNTQQLKSGSSGGATTVSGGGSDYYSLLTAGRATPKVDVPVETPNLLDRAGGLISKGTSFVKNYFDTQKQTVQKYQQTPGTMGVFQNIFENSMIPALDRQKQNIEVKMQTSGATNEYDAKQLEVINKLLVMTPDDRWNNRGAIKYFVNDINTQRNLKSLYSGTIATVNSLFDATAWLAGKTKTVKILNPVSSKLEDVFNKGSDNLDAWLKVLQPENPTFKEKISSGAGSSIPFFAIGAGTGKGAQFLARVSPRIAAWFGGSAAGAVEAMSEAGNVYDENLKKGMDRKEADKAANKTFGANIVLNILTDRFGVFSEDKLGLKKFLLSTSGEGIQEATQQVISNVNTGRPYDEGVVESGIIGSIIGGGLGTVGTDIDPQTGVSLKEEEQAPEEKPTTIEPIKLPDNIDQTVATKIQELNNQDVSNPVTSEDTIRVYQAEGKGEAGKTNWVFSTPEALASYMSSGDVSATPRFLDVKQADLIAHPERGEGVFTIEDMAKVLKSSDKLTVEPVKETITEKKQQKTINLFNGENKKVSEVSKQYNKVLDVKTNQAELIKKLADEGNVEAKRLFDSMPNKNRVDFSIADPIIRKAYKDQYDAISYENTDRPQIGREYHDLTENKFYATKRETASVYALQNRAGKYKKTKRRPSEIKTEKVQVEEQIGEKKGLAEGIATVAKDKRQGLNTTDIGNLKKIYFRSQKFQEGDIETIRASNSGKLLDRVLEDVQIKFPGMTEEDAFDYAMSLPTKADERIHKPPELKDLKDRLKKIDLEYADYVKKNGLAVGVRKKAIQNGLRMSFGSLPEYDMVNIKDQAEEALKILVADKSYATDIALGKVEPPPGILPESVFIAVENDALQRGDTELLRQLATESELVSDATAMGQRIRMLAERNPYSPTSAMDKVARLRKSIIEEKSGKKVSQLTKETVEDIKSEISKAQPKKSEWGLFIDSITCK